MRLQLRVKLEKSVTDHFLVTFYIFDRICKLVFKTDTRGDPIHDFGNRVNIAVAAKPVIADHARGNALHIFTRHQRLSLTHTLVKLVNQLLLVSLFKTIPVINQ